VLIRSSTTSGVGAVFVISTCLGRSCSFTPHTYSKHFPAAPGFLRITQVLPPLRPLHLDLGVPAEVYCYAPMATTPGNPGIVGRTMRGRCVRPEGNDARSLAMGSVGGREGVACCSLRTPMDLTIM
jgi:hypothetical protein